MEKLEAVLSERFLLIQIGNYGHGYEAMPIPPGLIPVALKRQQRGELCYPKSHVLPPPHFHVPADARGILMNKTDELRINEFAYWAQKLGTLVNKISCVNSSPDELLRFSKTESHFRAILVTKPTTTAPQGNAPGRVFEKWTPNGYVRESPTDHINTDVVYTEAGKSTLIFKSLEALCAPIPLDLNQYHVFFTPSGGLPHDAQYRGKRLPYRSSKFGTCSLLIQGKPDEDTGIPLLKPESASCLVVALASIHQHVCGRVF